MQPWQKAWREGFQPPISYEGLLALREALISDDPNLLQGSTTKPPPLMCVQDWDTEAACAVSYTGWKGDHLITVGEVEEYFARMCYECDQRIGEQAGCRHFLNWWDETPREVARQELLIEVESRLASMISI